MQHPWCWIMYHAVLRFSNLRLRIEKAAQCLTQTEIQLENVNGHNRWRAAGQPLLLPQGQAWQRQPWEWASRRRCALYQRYGQRLSAAESVCCLYFNKSWISAPHPPRHRSASVFTLLPLAVPTFVIASVKAGTSLRDSYWDISLLPSFTVELQRSSDTSLSLPSVFINCAAQNPRFYSGRSPCSWMAPRLPDCFAGCFMYKSPFPPQCRRTRTPSGEGLHGVTTALC